MSESGPQLTIVFNENGIDPIVLEGSWKHAGNRPAPNLECVGHGKKRLAAICIALLLAKYRSVSRFHETHFKNSDGVLKFQVPFKKGTWICTLAGARQALKDWLKTRFHIHDPEVFVRASRGSTENHGGNEHPSVIVDAVRLPLANIEFLFKAKIPANSPARLMQEQECLRHALKIEMAYWPKSTITHLFPQMAGSEVPGIEVSVSGAKFKHLPISTLPATAPALDATIESLKTINWEDHFDLIARVWIEKEVSIYRETCQPFFRYLGGSLNSSIIPFFWKERTLNVQQFETLRDNCSFFLSEIPKIVDFYEPFHYPGALVESGQDVGFIELFRPHLGNRQLSMLNEVLFEDLTNDAWVNEAKRRYKESEKDNVPWRDWVWAGNHRSPRILSEIKEIIRIVEKEIRGNDISLATGTFFALQIIWIDFINDICLSFFNPDSLVSSYGSFDSVVPDLVGAAMAQKCQAVRNRDLLRRFCKEPNEFVAAAQAARVLLQAQANGWGALHRRLVALEF